MGFCIGISRISCTITAQSQCPDMSCMYISWSCISSVVESCDFLSSERFPRLTAGHRASRAVCRGAECFLHTFTRADQNVRSGAHRAGNEDRLARLALRGRDLLSAGPKARVAPFRCIQTCFGSPSSSCSSSAPPLWQCYVQRRTESPRSPRPAPRGPRASSDGLERAGCTMRN